MEKAEVNYASKTVTITMKEGKTLTKETLDAAFKDSKFSVKSFEAVAEKKEESKEDSKKDDGKKEEKKEEGK